MYSNSLISEAEASLYGDLDQMVATLNPLTKDMTTLRPSLLPGFLKANSYNKNRNAKSLRFFELGNVFFIDIDKNKVELINNKKSPINEKDVQKFIKNKELQFSASQDYEQAFKSADFIIISTPTNFEEQNNEFDTSSVDSVVEKALHINPDACIIIKSTIPSGHTEKLRKNHNTDKIIFSPEFLREGKSLYDNLHPSRIIVGDTNSKAKEFAYLLKDAALKKDIPILFMNSEEAESVKLFANSYLAMRVSFFNELDNYAMSHNLDTKKIIDGISLDSRIGENYNNPSFGYGGYCLPKDTKQLKSNCIFKL